MLPAIINQALRITDKRICIMERNDIVVLENLQQEDSQPRFLVVLAKEIENHAADGSSYDYSLDNNESQCEYDMMKAIEKKFRVNTAELSLYGEDNELEACIGSEISDELLAIGDKVLAAQEAKLAELKAKI